MSEAGGRPRITLDLWDPGYGASVDGDGPRRAPEADGDASVAVDPWVEVAERGWAPRMPDGAEPLSVLVFVDGVRRVEAGLWITGADGSTTRGLAASWAAGAVRCDGGASIADVRVGRGLFGRGGSLPSSSTTAGTFHARAVADDDPDTLSAAVQAAMGALEDEVAAGARDRGDAIVVRDGPLRFGVDHGGDVGFVKTHHRSYGPLLVSQTVSGLAALERTPLLLVGRPVARFTWYMRLPCEVTHPWAGVVRLEVPAVGTAAEVAVLADRLAVTVPRFASEPRTDPRAPQNLTPIGALERRLRHRLGDPQVVGRALARATRWNNSGTP